MLICTKSPLSERERNTIPPGQLQTHHSSAMGEIIKDVTLALVGVLIAMMFNFISMVLTERETIEMIGMAVTPQNGELIEEAREVVMERVLGVHFSLWLIGASLYLGAKSISSSRQSGQLAFKTQVFIWIFVAVLLLMLVSQACGTLFHENRMWCKVYLPNVLGLIALGFASAGIQPPKGEGERQ